MAKEFWFCVGEKKGKGCVGRVRGGEKNSRTLREDCYFGFGMEQRSFLSSGIDLLCGRQPNNIPWG